MIERAVIRIEPYYLTEKGYDVNLFNWFVNQNHIPIDLTNSQYKELYNMFIKEVIEEFRRHDSEYYWFVENGGLWSDRGNPLVNSNGFKIDKDIMRSILRNNILEELLSN